MRTDTERLDFLERSKATVWPMLEHFGIELRDSDGEPFVETGRRLRSAIDAAMDAEEAAK